MTATLTTSEADDKHASVPYAGDSGEAYIVALPVAADGRAGWRAQVPLPDHLIAQGLRSPLTRTCRAKDSDTAKAAACAWRDHWHQVLYGKPTPQRVFHTRQSNGKTGVPGVRRAVKKVRSRHDRSRSYEVLVYIAEVWTTPGRDGKRPRGSKSRVFSVAKYGEEEAFGMACEWRVRAEAALAAGRPVPD